MAAILEHTDTRPRLLKIILKLDYLQIIAALILLAYGITFIYGSGYQHDLGDSSIYWIRQLRWAGVGAVLWLACIFINYRYIALLSPLFYVGSIILLIMVLFFGETYWGAKRWLDIGFMNIQPSEVAKFGFLTLCAWLLSLGLSPNKISTWGILFILTVIPFLLIFKEPDLGTALVIPYMGAVLIFAAGIKWRWILLALVLVCVAVPASYPFLEPHHKERIATFLNPEANPTDEGWTARQAKLSVGSGGMTGKGFTKGTLHTLGYLPKTVANSDFIFSVIAEETGFLGCSIFVFAYILLITSALRTAYLARDMFGRLVALGISALFFMHSLVNIGMNVQLFPITGIPLPLVSYGGTFMVTTFVYLGILQAIYIRRKRSLFSDEPEPVIDEPETL